ncbi:oxygenase MpaB family protein [Sphingobium sp.]|uniref:oxygenase MpaB family protein n=1 Tax=Sphingobium sp. TaxID=1912891 RepID=UPI0028BD1C8A|nr:oxygenase MpaB family protein [Sphingobium sp.]
MTDRFKQSIRLQVVRLLNDVDRGEAPVPRSANALFHPRSVVWRVHGDVGSMMVGGITSLLMQMLHPSVLAGVWDHSNFRADMHGRLRRTARFIATTTYGDREAAHAAINRVRTIHEKVRGLLPDGTPYRANDPELLAWVHVTETTSFLAAWIRYGNPLMSAADQDRYFAEMATIGHAMGADPLPRSQSEARAIIKGMRPELKADARTEEVAKLILGPPGISPKDLPRMLAMQAAIDLLPSWARRMHKLSTSPLERPFVRAGAFGVVQTLRWAFR